MPNNNIPFKSYCWSFGTTSFRTKNFNQKIEILLALLNSFWNIPNNVSQNWENNSPLQEAFYDFMKNENFLEGNASRKDKDAREKTSGLADIGLITANRKLTPVGIKLLELSKQNDFTPNNEFNIPKDSYIYLKQMAKTYNEVNGEYVRPYLVLLYLLTKFEYLTYEEFTYLLPLCINESSTDIVINAIPQIRSNQKTIDEVITSILLSMNNYQEAEALFLNNSVTEDLICTIGFNRKSRKFDKAYYPFYLELKKVFLLGKEDILPLYNTTKDITIGKHWRSFLFSSQSKRAIRNNGRELLNDTVFVSVKNEAEFKKLFFRYMHLFKAKATLTDYFDLNKRYIKNTDIVLFEDSTVKLDIIPKYIFKSIESDLLENIFSKTETLESDISINEIFPNLTFNKQDFISAVNTELNTSVNTVPEAQNAVDQHRYNKFNHLIDTKFTDEKLIELLTLFEKRKDDDINSYVTDNADIPTIFEYVLGILWYKVSERQGKILDYMKLSLDADLLPKTHAAGGEADIIYEYVETENYPEHMLLLEATLVDNTNQRRMEMEPVSRHLGRHLIRTGNLNSYCIFITTYLDINVIADFRGRKSMPFYDTLDYTRSINGMKIIPLQTSELKKIIKDRKTYKDLYLLFEDAYNSNLPPHIWYGSCFNMEDN